MQIVPHESRCRGRPVIIMICWIMTEIVVVTRLVVVKIRLMLLGLWFMLLGLWLM